MMNKEQLLKEARTTDAMREGYMGLEGKFAVIARTLGSPIVHHGGIGIDRHYLSDSFAEEELFPTMDEDMTSYELGYQFDGLSRGMNLQISVFYHLREIVVRHEGLIVYKEVSGELEGFAPDKIWEDKIATLFVFARSIEQKNRPIVKQQLAEEANKVRQKLLEELRLKWGL